MNESELERKIKYKSKREKFVCILSCDVVPVIRISAKICNDILALRRQLLYK